MRKVKVSATVQEVFKVIYDHKNKRAGIFLCYTFALHIIQMFIFYVINNSLLGRCCIATYICYNLTHVFVPKSYLDLSNYFLNLFCWNCSKNRGFGDSKLGIKSYEQDSYHSISLHGRPGASLNSLTDGWFIYMLTFGYIRTWREIEREG